MYTIAWASTIIICCTMLRDSLCRRSLSCILSVYFYDFFWLCCWYSDHTCIQDYITVIALAHTMNLHNLEFLFHLNLPKGIEVGCVALMCWNVGGTALLVAVACRSQCHELCQKDLLLFVKFFLNIKLCVVPFTHFTKTLSTVKPHLHFITWTRDRSEAV